MTTLILSIVEPLESFNGFPGIFEFMTFKRQSILDVAILSLFLFFLACFAFRLKGMVSGPQYTLASLKPKMVRQEEFDLNLIRLNSISKIVDYCDSFHKANPDRTYPGVVSQVVREKFFHGYSMYDGGTNPLAVLFEPIVKNGATAIVVPDDIAKHPTAACSQQSIVGMEVFKRKGYEVRKVSMYDSLNSVGHFAYEVYYDKSWHYFDTNQEPDMNVLRKYNRPSVAFLANHLDIVAAAYRNQTDVKMFERLVQSHKEGRVNVFPAPNAYLFQMTTKYASQFGWILFGAILFFRVRSRKRKQALAKPNQQVHEGELRTKAPELSVALNRANAV